MSRQVEPEAQFDSLSLGVKLYNYFDGFKREEIQLFSYFASVLFPYTKEPLSEWKYGYTYDTNSGYPFSAELNNAIELQILNGNFEEKGDFYIVTPIGMKTFDEIKELTAFEKREISINAACTSSILIPFKETEHALLNDPELKEKRALSNNSEWIKQDYLYDRILEISKQLGVPLENITASSVSWIKYLSVINKSIEDGKQ